MAKVPHDEIYEILDIISEYIEASARTQTGPNTWLCTVCEWPNYDGHAPTCIVGLILEHISRIIKEGIE